MSSETCDAEEDDSRFEIELYVIHPTLRPDDISRALGLDAYFSKAVGAPRTTPSGRPLSGTYADTQWRHTAPRIVQDQAFADQLAGFVESLKACNEALAMLRAGGGRTVLVVQCLGDYLADEIAHATLSRIVELGLSLGIECFGGAQA